MNDCFRPCVHSDVAAANIEKLSGKKTCYRVTREAFRQESGKWDVSDLQRLATKIGWLFRKLRSYSAIFVFVLFTLTSLPDQRLNRPVSSLRCRSRLASGRPPPLRVPGL